MNRLFASLQGILPQHLISRLIGRLAATKFWPLRKILIRSFLALYDVDMSEAGNSDPGAYGSFNALFSRALKSDARPFPSDPAAVVSPVDGTVSQCGAIVDGQLLQAKDRHFRVNELLGQTSPDAASFQNGNFVTIYLAPHNYHRIHTPVAARLRQMTHIPGRLFSVSPATTEAVSKLFARNERVVFHFDCDTGPLALVMVGALNVGSIETVHAGVIAPGGRQLRRWDYDPALSFERGQELGRFNLGSTVILLFPENGPAFSRQLQPAMQLKMGELIARL